MAILRIICGPIVDFTWNIGNKWEIREMTLLMPKLSHSDAKLRLTRHASPASRENVR